MQISEDIEASTRDRWVGIGLDSQIEPASSHPVIVDGHELALWRGESGPPRVWDDRCPHRGMRLSFGFVRGNALRCLYHGWGFGGDSQCVSIPAHPDLTPPKTICASAHGAETKYGIIWANMSASRAQPLPGLPVEASWLPVRSLYIRRSPADIVAGIEAFDFGEPASVAAPGDNIRLVTVGSHAHLLFALQPIEAGKTGLHIVASGGDEPSAARRADLVRQMHRLRGAIEAGPGLSQLGQGT